MKGIRFYAELVYPGDDRDGGGNPQIGRRTTVKELWQVAEQKRA